MSAPASGVYRDLLPAVLAADERFVNFVRIFEDVGTPLYDMAAGFPTMFDPRLSPPELARWLGSWLGAVVDESLPPDRRRKVTTAAAAHFGTRGTRQALEALLRAVTGGSAVVSDPGTVQRRIGAGADAIDPHPPPPEPSDVDIDGDLVPPAVIVLATRGGVPVDRLDLLLRSELPAWLPYRIVVEDEVAGDAAITDDAGPGTTAGAPGDGDEAQPEEGRD